MNFIESFFSWGEKPKEEIKKEIKEEIKEEIKISNSRDRVSKRFRKPKEIEEVDVEDVDA